MRCHALLLLAFALADAAAAQQKATVAGRVLGHLGGPTADIAVTVAPSLGPGTPLATARTGTDGAFMLTQVPAGIPLWIHATAPGHTVGRAGLLADTRVPNVVSLRLYEAIAVRGRVVEADGAPIAGAQVVGGREQRPFEGGCAPVEATTDEHGNFELRGLPPGDYVLRAWAPGHVLRSFWYSAAADDERVLPLVRGAHSLRVAAVGLPPHAARAIRVRLWSGLLPSALAEGELDADGRWQIEGLDGLDGLYGLDGRVALLAQDHVFAPRAQPFPRGALPPELRFVARPLHALVLRGTVRDEAGTPLASQTIARVPNSDDPMEARRETALIGADGAFELAVSAFAGDRLVLTLAGSPYVLLPEPGAAGARSILRQWPGRVQVIANPERAPRFGASLGVRVRARVRDRDGAPVSFAPVELQDRMDNRSPEWSTMERGVTGPDGTIAFATVPVIADAVRVWSHGPGGSGASAPWTLVAGESPDVEVRVQPNGAIAGRVLGADGSARAGVPVALHDRDPTTGGWSGLVLVPTDRAGRFRFVDVAPGDHRLSLRPDSKDEAVQPVVTVAAGETATQDIVDR